MNATNFLCFRERLIFISFTTYLMSKETCSKGKFEFLPTQYICFETKTEIFPSTRNSCVKTSFDGLNVVFEEKANNTYLHFINTCSWTSIFCLGTKKLCFWTVILCKYNVLIGQKIQPFGHKEASVLVWWLIFLLPRPIFHLFCHVLPRVVLL